MREAIRGVIRDLDAGVTQNFNNTMQDYRTQLSNYSIPQPERWISATPYTPKAPSPARESAPSAIKSRADELRECYGIKRAE